MDLGSIGLCLRGQAKPLIITYEAVAFWNEPERLIHSAQAEVPERMKAWVCDNAVHVRLPYQQAVR